MIKTATPFFLAKIRCGCRLFLAKEQCGQNNKFSKHCNFGKPRGLLGLILTRSYPIQEGGSRYQSVMLVIKSRRVASTLLNSGGSQTDAKLTVYRYKATSRGRYIRRVLPIMPSSGKPAFVNLGGKNARD
jgi:hypothetical protein